jgi:hypothetical protein
MASSDTRKPNYFRRMVWLAVFIVVLFGGYSAGWYYVGNLLESEVRTALADANEKGLDADCANPTARGYPFRIGLYCDTVSFDDRKSVSVSAGAFRSAAQIYNPFRIIGELDGPATVDVKPEAPVKLEWQTLRASVRLAAALPERDAAMPLPERISLEGTAFAAGPLSASALINAKAFEGHMRPNGKDLDIAGSIGDLTAATQLLEGRVLPPLSGSIDATVANGVALLQSKTKSLRGQAVTIRQLTVSVDAKTGIDVTGAISADKAGLLDADLMITVRNAEKLAQVAAKAFPEKKKEIDKAMVGIAMLGESTSLPLKIVKGKAMLAFIPLGDVKPVK